MDDKSQDTILAFAYILLILIPLLGLTGCSTISAINAFIPQGKHADLSQQHLAQPDRRSGFCDPRWMTCDKRTPAERDGN